MRRLTKMTGSEGGPAVNRGDQARPAPCLPNDSAIVLALCLEFLALGAARRRRADAAESDGTGDDADWDLMG